MEERKLGLALPLGKLMEQDKWNVSNIMRRAGIISYHKEREYPTRLFDKSIKPSFLKPRDIPLYLKRGICDVGITGRDLVEEAGLDLEELCDLGCGYVDICLMTTQETWQNVQNFWSGQNEELERLRKHGITPSSMEMLLGFFYWLRTKRVDNHDSGPYRDTRFPTVVFGTEYPSIAGKINEKIRAMGGLTTPMFDLSIDQVASILKTQNREYGGQLAVLDILPSHGQTEQHLRDRAVDLILETIATGDSSKDLVIFEKVLDSTARLYASPTLADEWKKQKAHRLVKRISKITREVEEHCQAEMTITYPRTDLFKMPFREGLFTSCYSFGEAVASPMREHVIATMPKASVDELKSVLARLGNGYSCEEIKIFDLARLYRYCPVLMRGSSYVREWERNLDYRRESSYPSVNSEKLRPEHRKQAVLFEMPSKSL